VHIPKNIKVLLVSVLFIALLVVGLFIHSRSALQSPINPNTGLPMFTPAEIQKVNSMTDAQKQALSHFAHAEDLSIKKKDHDGAISELRLAIKEDPVSRDYPFLLAREFWDAKRTSDAVTIWKKLAEGNDDVAKRSAKRLAKIAEGEPPTQL
jgi:hypothetical protein